MNVLFTGDIIQADTIELTLPRTALSSGATHSSVDENIRALFESLDLEVLDYESFVRIPIGATVDMRDAQQVQIKLMSKAHVERLQGRR
jgi:hypothetical protein